MKKVLIIIFIFLKSNLFAQCDSLVSVIYRMNDMKIYKNTCNQTYKIKRQEKLIWKNLKYAQYFNDSFEVLDKNNSFFYINEQGNRLNKKPVTFNSVCLTFPHYKYEVIVTDNKYILTKYGQDIREPIEIGSINKEGIQKIYFYNNTQIVNYDLSFLYNFPLFQEILIIEKENQKGLFYNNELTFYDEVIYINGVFRIKKNGLIGLYKITPIKYKELELLTGTLARFKLENGKTGFIDKNGKEYFDYERLPSRSRANPFAYLIKKMYN